MTHVYPIVIDYLDDNFVDELAVKVMKQARISTRRHNHKWDLNVEVTYMEVIFSDKLDYDDFMETFSENNKDLVEFNSTLLGF